MKIGLVLDEMPRGCVSNVEKAANARLWPKTGIRAVQMLSGYAYYG
jgi:hypothetical protein